MSEVKSSSSITTSHIDESSVSSGQVPPKLEASPGPLRAVTLANRPGVSSFKLEKENRRLSVILDISKGRKKSD